MTARQQILIWTTGIVVSFLALYWLRAILLPFIAGAALAYFLDPAADKLESWRVPRSAATAILLILFFAFFIGIVVLVVPLIQDQIGSIADRFPEYVARLGDLMKSMGKGRLAELLGLDPAGLQSALQNVAKEAATVVTKLAANLVSSGVAFLGVLSLVLITPVVAFFLLRDWDKIIADIDAWLPRKHAEVIREQARQIDRVLSGFVHGQALDCLVQGILYAIGWTAVGLDFAIVLGLLNGLLNFIPYVGTTFGFLLAMLIAFGQFGPDLTPLLLVAAVHVAVQTTDQAFLTPKLIGPRVGLHPVWILFALLAGGSLLGVVGVLVAVPLAAAVGVLTRFAIQQYKESELYLGTSDTEGGGKAPP